MMSFCKTVLCFPQSKDPPRNESPRHCRSIPTPVGGLSFIAGETAKPANVLESAGIKPTALASDEKKTWGEFGFHGDNGDGVDGLFSCTESLGCESSNDRRNDDDDQLEELSRSRWRTVEKVRRQDLKYPPPLPSLNRNGQPSFFLKPVRKDGRLELIEVRIDRPEIFRASRRDGRLQLQLIKLEPQDPLQEDEEEEEEEVLSLSSDQEEEEMKQKGEKEVGRDVSQWAFPLTTGDGFRRCHELSNNHYHQHYLPLWSHHCVTIR